MRVTTAFSRLLRLGTGVVVKRVRFEPDRVVVEVALRRRRLVCPECGYSTRARKDTRPEDSVWRHLDLGIWRLEIHCRRRRLWCPEHGARTEGVPFARPGAEFTRDFECLVAWLATRTDKTTIKRMLRIDWDTVGRIIKRVCDDELDPDRLDELYDIGIDEVCWKRQHNYLTLVADHLRGKIVWGCEGKGEKAADAFFEELDPEPAAPSPPPKQPRGAPEPAIMVPFGPCPTVPAGHGIPPRGCARPRARPGDLARASRLSAVSMDMTGGYANSVRHHAPQAIICIDPYHVVQLANQALDEVRRAYWNELRSLDDQRRRQALQGRPLVPAQDDPRSSPTSRPPRSPGSGPPAARSGAPTRSRKPSAASSSPGSRLEDVEVLIDRLLQPPGPQPPGAVRPARQDDPQTPRRDPRRDPPRHQPRPHRGAQQQGPAHHPPRVRLPLRQGRARAHHAHLRPHHPSPPTRTTRARDRVTLTTFMPREPKN